MGFGAGLAIGLGIGVVAVIGAVKLTTVAICRILEETAREIREVTSDE